MYDVTSNAAEAKLAKRVTAFGMLTNVAFTVGKGIIGTITGSAALIADAVHSASDLVSDVVTLWAVTISRRPHDDNHLYGHGRFESIGTFFVGALLVVGAVGIGHHAIEHFDAPMQSSQMAFYMALASLISKEVLYQVTYRIGKRMGSDLLIANAWHHRSDSLSAGIALVGIGGAMFGVSWADPAAAVAVGVLMAGIGVRTCYSSLRELTDTVVDVDLTQQVRNIVDKIEGIKSSGMIRSRKLGHYNMIDLSIDIDENKSIGEAQDIITRAKGAILSGIPRTSEVLIYLVDKPIGALPPDHSHDHDHDHDHQHNHDHEHSHEKHAHTPTEKHAHSKPKDS